MAQIVRAVATHYPPAEPATCRICMEPGENMMSPCRCKGTIRYVHRACIQEWVRKNHLRCTACDTPYPTTRDGPRMRALSVAHLVADAVIAAAMSYAMPWLVRLVEPWSVWAVAVIVAVVPLLIPVALFILLWEERSHISRVWTLTINLRFPVILSVWYAVSAWVFFDDIAATTRLVWPHVMPWMCVAGAFFFAITYRDLCSTWLFHNATLVNYRDRMR